MLLAFFFLNFFLKFYGIFFHFFLLDFFTNVFLFLFCHIIDLGLFCSLITPFFVLFRFTHAYSGCQFSACLNLRSAFARFPVYKYINLGGFCVNHTFFFLVYFYFDYWLKNRVFAFFLCVFFFFLFFVFVQWKKIALPTLFTFLRSALISTMYLCEWFSFFCICLCLILCV